MELYHGAHTKFKKHMGQWWTTSLSSAQSYADKYGKNKGVVSEATIDPDGLKVLDAGRYDRDADVSPGDGDIRNFRGWDLVQVEDEDVRGRPHDAYRIVSKNALRRLQVKTSRRATTQRSQNNKQLAARLKR